MDRLLATAAPFLPQLESTFPRLLSPSFSLPLGPPPLDFLSCRSTPRSDAPDRYKSTALILSHPVDRLSKTRESLFSSDSTASGMKYRRVYSSPRACKSSSSTVLGCLGYE